MNVSIFSYILVLFIILNSVCAKSIYESDSKLRDDSEVKLYPIKRKSPTYEQSYYVVAHEEQPEVDYQDSLNNLEGSSAAQRYRRIEEPSAGNLLANNLQSVRDYKQKPSLFDRQLDLRRQVMLNENRRSDRLTKRDSESLPLQSDDSIGMVYRKGRLVGILEPYPPAYELSPLSNIREGVEEIQPLPLAGPNIRQVSDAHYANKMPAEKQVAAGDWNWEKAEGAQDAAARYADEKYPMVLTDFKIDSKLSSNRDNLQNEVLSGKAPENNIKIKTVTDEMSLTGDKSNLVNNPKKEAEALLENSADMPVKRSASAITDEKVSELKSALNRIQNPDPSDKVEEIEEDLRGILNDMGLIDNVGKADAMKNKRSAELTDNKQVAKEDENLEEGANKIEVVKTTHEALKEGKEKREEGQPQTGENLETREAKLTDKAPELKAENDAAQVAETDSEKDSKEESEAVKDIKRDVPTAAKINVADYQSEGAAYIRNKRQETSTGSSDIMKGLEKSGELTVSGNKSPLASSENGPAPDAGEKRSGLCPSSTQSIPHQPQAELTDDKYQADIERNLQAKIDAIKEEVKREIAAMQAKNAEKEKQRKKRSLSDGETSAVNPQEHPEEKLVPYIRRKRNLESLEDLTWSKRDLPLASQDTGEKPSELSIPHQAQAELSDDKYQADIERSIQAKINAIKEQVLSDGGTSVVNSQKHTEEKLVPHIRHKRNLGSLEDLTRPKRDLPLASPESGPASDAIQKRLELYSSIPHQSQAELTDDKYQADIERNIQAKIDGIKEQVLSDGGTSVVNSQKHTVPHIRNKRNLGSLEDLTRPKRDLPLASPESGPASDAIQKRLELYSSIPHQSPAELTDDKYQADIERNIQAKIDGIKEQVLSDGGTSAVNPQEHTEEKLVPHIRRKRSLESLEDLTRPKRGLPDYSNLKNIDTGDYLDLNGDKRREVQYVQSDYQMDPQENKYLPENSQNADENIYNDNNSKEKRNTDLQQDNLMGAEVVNSKVNRQEKLVRISDRSLDDSGSNVVSENESQNVRISERSLADSGLKLASENENVAAAKEADALIKQNNEATVEKSPPTGEANQAPLIQQNDDNLKSLKQSVSQDNIKKREDASGQPPKKLIDSVVNQQFQVQLNKLNADGVTPISIEREIMKNTRSDNQEVTKKNVDQPKTEMQRALEKGTKDTKQETVRRRRQVSEEVDHYEPKIIYRRRKRANAVVPEGNVAYVPYRPDEDDVDDEGDEFDDDGFDDRTASMQKREAAYNNNNLDDSNNNQYRRSADYGNYQEYEAPEGYFVNNYQPNQRNSLARRYVARINSDLYENPSPGYVGNYMYNPDGYVRRKRQDFDQLLALHGGGNMRHHIAAVKERSDQHLDDYRKPSFKHNQNREEGQSIADLSSVDLFGGLPQGYEGELSRFKRIKRVAEDVKKQV